VFMALAFSAPLPRDEYALVRKLWLCEKYSWTLDYVDALPEQKFLVIETIAGAVDSAITHLRKRKNGR
jgi:hypothetical protein